LAATAVGVVELTGSLVSEPIVVEPSNRLNGAPLFAEAMRRLSI
jgi:hypothetical protein